MGEDMKNLPSVIVGGGIALLGGYLLFQGVSNIFLEKENEETVNESSAELEKELAQGRNLTFSEIEYHRAADILEKALNGSGINDDTNTAVKTLLRIVKSKQDWLALEVAYGLREDYAFFMPVGKVSLVQALSSELYPIDVKTLRENFKKVGLVLPFLEETSVGN